jgi:hypothetical protein
MLAAVALLAPLALAVLAVLYQTQIADFACSKLGLLCPPGGTAARTEDAETDAFTKARTCSAADVCGARLCTAPYRRTYPTGKFMPEIQALEQDAANKCERQVFDNDAACASPKELAKDFCHVAACFVTYQSQYPNGRFATPVRQRIDEAKRQCELQAELGAFTEASECAKRNPCAAQNCFADYKSKYPSGSFRTRMESELQDAARSCRPGGPPTPAPTPIPPAAPQQALPDGTYPASRGYSGPKSVSDPTNCPPSTSFEVTVDGSTIRFQGPDQLQGQSITRYWSGTIDQRTGRIDVDGRRASPPTRSDLRIYGPYDNATIDSAFCGSGSFKIFRR